MHVLTNIGKIYMLMKKIMEKPLRGKKHEVLNKNNFFLFSWTKDRETTPCEKGVIKHTITIIAV